MLNEYEKTLMQKADLLKQPQEVLIQKEVEVNLMKLTKELEEREVLVQELQDQVQTQKSFLDALETKSNELAEKEKDIKEKMMELETLKKEIDEKEADVGERDKILRTRERQLEKNERHYEDAFNELRLAQDNLDKKELRFDQEVSKAVKENEEIKLECEVMKNKLVEREKKLLIKEKEIERKAADINIELEKLKLIKELNNSTQRTEDISEGELRVRLKELDILKQQNNLKWNEKALVKKVKEVNSLFQQVIHHIKS